VRTVSSATPSIVSTRRLKPSKTAPCSIDSDTCVTSATTRAERARTTVVIRASNVPPGNDLGGMPAKALLYRDHLIETDMRIDAIFVVPRAGRRLRERAMAV
jgi:hypothetical protein